MAERRMFAKTIIDSDAFLDMPVTARLLYYDLAMRADDDGFVNSPKKIMRMVGAAQDDLSVLISKKFIIPFESGVVVIKHWRIHNYIRNDRYKPTTYQKEKALLVEENNKAYHLVDQVDTNGIPKVSDRETQDRLGKDRIDNTMSDLADIERIIKYLNASVGSHYSAKSKANIRHIRARFAEGFNPYDFKRVIDTKVDEWKDRPEMRKYLRPETLFGTKFESYLNQVDVEEYLDDDE